MAQNILTVKDLSVSYKAHGKGLFGEEKKIQVLNGVSFEMKEGEILGLVGESGSGKSTLAKAVLGLIPYQGEVTNSSAHPQMIFQDPYSSLNPAKKVGWLLEEALRLGGEKRKDIRRQRTVEMLQKVGLDEKYLERYPSQLSGGQRQRVCIAQALMQSPKLLFADEPVSALDVTVQAQILDLMCSLQQEMGLSILFISHDLRVVYRMCQRVMIMKKGQILESGLVDEVYFHHRDPYTGTLLQAAGIK